VLLLGGNVMFEIDVEGDWLVSLDDKTKAVFLATLAHNITIAGRDSYTVQAEGLDRPADLKRINEIQHRVVACLQGRLINKTSVEIQRSIARWVLLQSEVNLLELMSWAWRDSKEIVPSLLKST
jgi:hypothetical protein